MKKFAFTLAEVLITLGIIGVVAAMTIPTLMNSTNDAEFKTAYKKAFSAASQAWMTAVSEGNIESRTGWGDTVARTNNFNNFKTYFKVIKDCNNSDNTTCWSTQGEKFFTAHPGTTALAFVDASGATWSITDLASADSFILVDTNGLKGPNVYGKDRAYFMPVAADGNMATAGIPVKITASPDFTTADVNHCKSGDTHPCLYTTWLFN